jgi:hypothetical protein
MTVLLYLLPSHGRPRDSAAVHVYARVCGRAAHSGVPWRVSQQHQWQWCLPRPGSLCRVWGAPAAAQTHCVLCAACRHARFATAMNVAGLRTSGLRVCCSLVAQHLQEARFVQAPASVCGCLDRGRANGPFEGHFLGLLLRACGASLGVQIRPHTHAFMPPACCTPTHPPCLAGTLLGRHIAVSQSFCVQRGVPVRAILTVLARMSAQRLLAVEPSVWCWDAGSDGASHPHPFLRCARMPYHG